MPLGGILGAIGSGILGANAAGDAAKAAQAAADNSRQFINGVYNTAEGNLNPFITAGKTSTNALQGLLGIGGDPAAAQKAFQNYLNSTNYQFQLGQGLNAVATANAPAFHSGATAKALNNYAQGMAGNALAGYENLLTGQQQVGAQSALGLGQIGSSLAPSLVGANNALAGALGSAAIARGNSLGTMIGGITGNSSFTNALNGIGDAIAGAL